MNLFKHWLVGIVTLALTLLLGSCGGGDQQALNATHRVSQAAAVVPYVANPQNGWWWDPNESGSGYALEVQGNQIFLAAFMYETNGASTWYASNLTLQTDNSFVGVLSAYQGGQTLLGAYQAPTNASIANAALAFTSATSGTLQIQPLDGRPSRTVTLSRFPISTPTPFATPTSTFESGWWWNANQSGRGFFIEVQGSQAFIAAFMYDSAGQPTWYAGWDPVKNGTVVSGALQQYTNGQTLTGTWRAPTQATNTAGTLTFNLTSPTTGSMTLPDGSTVQLSRFVFNANATPPPGGTTGGGTAANCSTPTIVPNLPPMIDSLGNAVAEDSFGGGDSGAAGADGSAGDGAPIANAPVTLTDNAGHTVTTTTDATGYYRVNVKCFIPPFVAKVVRPDGTVWYSPSTSPVKTRGFVTMNITGLTDKASGYVADSANISGGAEKVTPAVLATNPSALLSAKTKLNAGLTSPLTYVSLDPATFDPVATPYEAVKTDNYDRLLERLIASKNSTDKRTVVVGTFAGVKESFIDGPSTVATFGSPNGVALDSGGNVYVADTDNNAIRKISPAGVVSTLAGSGTFGFTNGTGTAATFNAPIGVALDASGNVYVADTANSAIRKITPAGVVSTLAGGSYGFTDGTGTAASFNGPRGVAVDSSGNVYVADTYNHAIRKITPGGVVSTLVGNGTQGFTNGTGAVASFNAPGGVAVDRGGNVFVADTNNHAIRKITPDGVVSTLAGSGSYGFTDGTGTVASFSFPYGVAVDSSGNVYATDTDNNAIRKITPAGVVSTLAGGSWGFTNGAGTVASFNTPYSVAVDSNSNVFVADYGNHAIRKITPAGVVSTLAGIGSLGFADGTGTAASFNYPRGVAVDGTGNLFVADTYNCAIRKITSAGVVSTLAGGTYGFTNGTGTAASFSNPEGVAIDSSGNVYVADTSNNVIRKITPAGAVSTLAGNGSPGFTNGSGTAASFNNPGGIAVDSNGNVYVADTANNVIRKITPAGAVSTLAGNGSPGLTNGTGTAASFNNPEGVAVDGNGNVYVADSANQAIRKISAAGVVNTLAGGSVGFANGTGAVAGFAFPKSLAIDSGGNVYAADTDNHAIRKITPAGVVNTVSGDGTLGYRNNLKTAARFNSPSGIAVDSSGNVFVGDSGNNAIRIILP